MNGKRAREQRRQYQPPSLTKWREAMAQYQELAGALDEADKVLIRVGRRDLANKLFKAQSLFAVQLVYLAPPEIAKALAAKFEHLIHPKA